MVIISSSIQKYGMEPTLIWLSLSTDLRSTSEESWPLLGNSSFVVNKFDYSYCDSPPEIQVGQIDNSCMVD